MRFSQKGVFVTGAGSGIGRATSLRLASEGAALLCFDSNAKTAEATAVLIRQQGGIAVASQGDVRDKNSIEQAVALALDHFGSISYLVNNAGLVRMSGFADITEEEWDLVMDVNLKGQFLTAQVVAPVIAAAGGGAIVNLSTVESEVIVASGPHCQPHYNASKGGVRMLTKAMAHELAEKNIRVNAVAPGVIQTPMLEGLKPEVLAEYIKQIPAGRLGLPADVAHAVLFLACEESSYISGQTLPITGGWI